jgi:hypothetical protein
VISNQQKQQEENSKSKSIEQEEDNKTKSIEEMLLQDSI